MQSELYYESHITIEPVFDERLKEFEEIAQKHSFRVAKLLMQKRNSDKPDRSNKDSFCTTRNIDFSTIEKNTIDMVVELKQKGFKVWRYKIEDTVLDSKIKDIYGLLL